MCERITSMFCLFQVGGLKTRDWNSIKLSIYFRENLSTCLLEHILEIYFFAEGEPFESIRIISKMH